MQIIKNNTILLFLLLFNPSLVGAISIIDDTSASKSNHNPGFENTNEAITSKSNWKKINTENIDIDRLEIEFTPIDEPLPVNVIENKKQINQENTKNESNLSNDNEGNQPESRIEDIPSTKKKRSRKRIVNQENPPSPPLNEEQNIKVPPVGKISVGEFVIPTRGYVVLNGQNISLNLIESDPIEALKVIARIGGYGLVFVASDNGKEAVNNENYKNRKISANFNDENISDAFNSILMASGLQAKLEKNIIFVGQNILNKSLIPKLSRTYRLNQANAASVADYLATLGAKISKVLVKGASVDGQEVKNSSFQAELNESYIKSYGVDGGPLQGLIGTVDLRLQTITLIGSNDLISTAEKYIKAMDVRHRQVALSIKILDVSLTKNDIVENKFDLTKGATTLVINNGMGIITGNSTPRTSPSTALVPSSNNGEALIDNQFLNWIQMKLTNENAKIMASPTLILGENSDAMISGVASAEGGLDSAAIGRPFANEGFVKVGETVTTAFDVTTEDGVTSCSATPGTAGITFGAKVDKIDDNGYVTFSLSPAISSVTKTETVGSCGTASTLSVRKLDTGSIRVKDGNTLILTGVLKDEDNVTTSKVPLLGDVPLIGRIFRTNTTVKRKSELIILVTPRILND